MSTTNRPSGDQADGCVLSLSTDACCKVITLGVQRDMFDLREAASRGPSALADILVANVAQTDWLFNISDVILRRRIIQL